jgi:hypothetical protein
MNAADFPILSHLVRVASGGRLRLDAARLRREAEPLFDASGGLRSDAHREIFVRLLESLIEVRPAPPQGGGRDL